MTLLERLRTPDDQLAWARFVDIYTPVLYRWARKSGLSDQDAGDLLQDLFIHLLKKLPEFTYDPNKGKFRGWLKMVALNQLRQKARRKRDVAVGSAIEQLDQVDEDVAEAFWKGEFRDELVSQAMIVMQRDFEPATWKACWETAITGRSAADVAGELGMTVNAVYAARSRVLRRLREEIGEMLE